MRIGSRASKAAPKALPLLGLALFAYIVSLTGIEKILSVLLKADPVLMLAGLLAACANVFIRSERWRLIIETHKCRMSLFQAARLWLIGFSAGFVTPGKMGDFIRAFKLSKITGLETGKSIATVFIDRTFDIFSMLLFGAAGLFFLAKKAGLSEDALYSVYAIAAVAILINGLSLKRSFMTFLARPFFHSIIPESKRGKIREEFDSFFDAVGEVSRSGRKLWAESTLTLAGFFIVILECYFLALSLGINPGLTTLVLIMPPVFLLETVPISVSGIGTRDAALVAILSMFSVSPERAVSFSLLILIVNVIIGLAGYAVWMKSKEKEKDEAFQSI